MSYFILKTKEFSTGLEHGDRTLYLLKKKHVPYDEHANILRLNCSSIQRLSRISELLSYLAANTADSHHVVQPYIIRKISWKDAIGIFGLDSESDSTDSA